jgi:hypothetical protein
MYYLVSVDCNGMAALSPEVNVTGFKKCCLYSAVDVTKDDTLWNVYVQLKVQSDVLFICTLYSSLFLALHVSGAICTHPQEHKLLTAIVGVCNLWKAEVINSIKQCGAIFFT